jgi:cyclopropane-fatty-acyl-phospholipid synthase
VTITDILDRVASRWHDVAFTVEDWNGKTTRYGSGPQAFVIRLRDRAMCEGLLENPSLRFGEAYIAGAIEIDGDLQALITLLFRLDAGGLPLGTVDKLRVAGMRWRHRGSSRRRARAEVAHHYDVGNEFFQLWLGRAMAYSCAYFRSPDDDIDVAQEAKFRHIAAKLRLEKGLRLLDIGCGWGGFARHVARHHDVEVLGVTLSEAQQRFAAEAVATDGLSDRVRIELRDYRDIAAGERFDRIVSLGMFEHVGRDGIRDYFRHTARLLAEGGVGVLQSIGRMAPAATDAWIGTHVFPGVYFPALAEIVEGMGGHGLHVADVEALRVHYALTLERWREALERNLPAVQRMQGDAFARTWRLYLAGSAAAFRVGSLNLWQIQLTRGTPDHLPLTREYLYTSPGE